MQSPLFQSLALVMDTENETKLWVRLDMMTDEAKASLQDDVDVRSFDNAISDLKQIAESYAKLETQPKILIPDKSFYLSGASFALYEAMLPLGSNISLDQSPILQMKAVKNDIEAKGKRILWGHPEMT